MAYKSKFFQEREQQENTPAAVPVSTGSGYKSKFFKSGGNLTAGNIELPKAEKPLTTELWQRATPSQTVVPTSGTASKPALTIADSPAALMQSQTAPQLIGGSAQAPTEVPSAAALAGSVRSNLVSPGTKEDMGKSLAMQTSLQAAASYREDPTKYLLDTAAGKAEEAVTKLQEAQKKVESLQAREQELTNLKSVLDNGYATLQGLLLKYQTSSSDVDAQSYLLASQQYMDMLAQYNAGVEQYQKDAETYWSKYDSAFERVQKAQIAYEKAQSAYLDKHMTEEEKYYHNLTKAEDFEEKSQYVSTEKDNVNDVKINPFTGSYTDTGFSDILYDYINGNAMAQSRQDLNDANGGGPGSMYTTTHTGWKGLPEEAVKIFNYLYATQGADAAYEYINSVTDKGRSGVEDFALGFMQGTGTASISAALGQGAAAITGDEEIRQRNADWYNSTTQEAAKAAAEAPGLYNAGASTGALSILLSIGEGVGAVTGLTKLPVLAKAIVNGAATFGGYTAVQNAGAAATGNMTAKEYLKNVGVNALGGAAGGAAGVEIGQLGTTLLKTWGLSGNALANTVVAGLSGAGFSAGNTGVQEMAKYLEYPEGYAPDAEQITKDILVAFAFASLSYLIHGGPKAAETEKAEAEKPYESEYFSEDMTEEEARKAYKELIKKYHPDRFATADAETQAAMTAKMKQINVDYEELLKRFAAGHINTAAEAYKQATTSTGAEAEAAAETFTAELKYLQEAARDGSLATTEATEAVQILTAAEAGLSGAAAAVAASGVPAVQEAAAMTETPDLAEPPEGTSKTNVSPMTETTGQQSEVQEESSLQTPATTETQSSGWEVIVDQVNTLERDKDGNIGQRQQNQIHDEAVSSALTEIQRDIENGMSQQALYLKARNYERMLQQIQASMPSSQSSNEADTMKLQVLDVLSVYYDIAAQNPKQALEEIQKVINMPDQPAVQAAVQPETEGIQWAGNMPETLNGGIENEIRQQPGIAWAGTAGENISGGDTGRLSGESTGGQAGVLAESPEGARKRTAEQSRTAIGRQNRAKSLQAQKVSSFQLGVENGTDAEVLTLVPEEAWDEGMNSTAIRAWEETGKEVTYVLGRIPVRTTDGGTSYVRGVYSKDGIIIQADNLRMSIDQIADHEIFHDKTFQTPGLIREIEQRIVEKYGEEEFAQIVNTYIQKLRGIIDIPENASDFEIEEVYQQIEEEIFADAYAGFNAFSAHAERFNEDVEQTMKDRGIGRGSQYAAATERTTGPPENGTRFSLEGHENDLPALLEQGTRQAATMEPVREMDGSEFEKRDRNLTDQVSDYFDSIGNKAVHPILGEVVLDKKGAKADIAHGIGRKKAAAFLAVPDVVEKGGLIDYRENWKDRGYDTAVLAAPVKIADQKYLMGVVLERRNGENQFYVHEVLAESNEGATPFWTGTIKDGTPGDDAPSVLSLLQKVMNVKRGNVRYSLDSEGNPLSEKQQVKATKPAAESKPIIAKNNLKTDILNLFSVPEGQKAEMGKVIEQFADRLLKNGELTQQDREDFFDRMYSSGVMTVPADEYYRTGREAVKDGRVYVSEQIKQEFGDDWNEFRKRAFSAGVYLTNDSGKAGVDSWNTELSEMLPGLFDANETDFRTILERIVQVAEEGKDEKVSLAEYTAQLAEQEHISIDDLLDNMERQMDWTLRTFAEKANLEIKLRDRTGVKIAQERERFAESNRRQQQREALRRAKEREDRREMLQQQRENREIRDLQQKTLKQLQWLSKNRYRAPEELKSAWDEVLGDIDIYAVNAANEMHWSKKHNATWKDLAEMYKDAKKNDPNFLPSKELEMIVSRLDGDKISDMDVGALQDLYKAAVGLRTEFYNRNNVINDEKSRLFSEVYADSKQEIKDAPGGFTGNWADHFMNLEQMTPLNVLQRMGGWNPDGAFYSMAKQLEKGERDIRDYTVRANRRLDPFLTEHQDWVKKADGQGKDAIWYEIEVPELIQLNMGDKPIFGDTVKVYMTPAQKVHLYLESKNTDNLRHMTGGRTFVNKELYSKGKRQEALAQGTTIKLAPETVKKLVSDLTDEEMELARILESYYNDFATERINAVSNVLYGYDKAMGKNYAPIYTNRNYTKGEIGVYNTTAEGVGNLKSRQYAVNPSYNISAFDAFERHVDQTARFVGMAIPARNWNTLLNWREIGNSMGDVITHKWGDETLKYINGVLTELQGGNTTEEGSTAERLMNTALSNYISSVFGFNPSIVFKQAMSFPLAGTYLGWGNMPNIEKALKTDDELINTYTSELAYRLMGYSTPETAQLKENPSKLDQNKVLNFTFRGGAITAMDGWTVKTIWRWAENKVRKMYPDMEVGSQDQIKAGNSQFYKEVAKEFEEAVSRSQPMYDVMHRSQIMRKSGMVRALTLFKTVPQQQYNMLRQTEGEAQYYKRAFKSGKASKEEYTQAKKKVGRATLGIIVAGLGIEAINFLNAMLKNNGKQYLDDDNEMTWASAGLQFLEGFASDNLGMIIGGDLTVEVLGSVILGDDWYGIETPGITQIEDVIEEIISGCQTIQSLVSDSYDVLADGGNLAEYLKRHGADYLGALDEALETVATYFGGVAANNIKSYTLGALKWISPEIATAYEDLLETADKSGLSGLTGEALETRVGDILENRLGGAEDETAAALAALYEAGYKNAIPTDTPSSVTLNEEKISLSAYQQQFYDTVWRDSIGDAVDELVSSDTFQEADLETQAKMAAKLYSYAAEKAKAALFEDYETDSWVADADEAVKEEGSLAEWASWYILTSGVSSAFEKMTNAGMSKDDALKLATAFSELEPLDGKKSVSSLQKYQTIITSGLPEQEQAAAIGALMQDSQRETFEELLDKGLTPKQYVEYKTVTADLTSEKDADGNTIQGSKKEKVLAAIDDMNISDSLKTALYFAEGYTESTLDEAPWYNGLIWAGS